MAKEFRCRNCGREIYFSFQEIETPTGRPTTSQRTGKKIPLDPISKDWHICSGEQQQQQQQQVKSLDTTEGSSDVINLKILSKVEKIESQLNDLTQLLLKQKMMMVVGGTDNNNMTSSSPPTPSLTTKKKNGKNPMPDAPYLIKDSDDINAVIKACTCTPSPPSEQHQPHHQEQQPEPETAARKNQPQSKADYSSQQTAISQPSPSEVVAAVDLPSFPSSTTPTSDGCAGNNSVGDDKSFLLLQEFIGC
jgi:hypothetical protein